MAWTEMQKKAIYTRGNNIIVSAGAGSGKTAVLSERILDYCLKGNDIRRVLVLTFTNAAALEMKERIRKKLIDNNLLAAASLIDSAYITTFDAYSLAIVKKYYYEINISKNVGIIDQALLEVKKKEILDGLFTELYSEKNQSFLALLKKYAKQNDEGLKEIILYFLSKLELIINEEEFVNNYEKNYYNAEFINNLVAEYEKQVLLKIDELIKELEALLNLAITDEVSTKLYDAVKTILTSLRGIQSYDDGALYINTLTLPRINPKAAEDVKTKKALCGDLLKQIKEKCFSRYTFLNDAKEEIYSIKNDVIYFFKLAIILKQRIMDYKYEIMCFDYIDIAKMAINLVTNNKTVHDEISNNLDEILIDEYQDTSDIQEAFIKAISNNNCYMVGDIKQSIYRFRNANPYIFKNKYDSYSKNDGGLKIDLTYNFRSRKEVIENINSIFSYLMQDDCGDANYAQDHLMHYGQTAYLGLKQNVDFNMEILSYSSMDSFSDEEIEAFICGNKIKQLVNSDVKCLKKNGFSKVNYNDIAILIDKTKSFIAFKKIFEYLQIPLSIDADLDLNNSILPILFSNILILIASEAKEKKYNHALASLCRSFLFSYNDDMVYDIVVNNKEEEINSIINDLRLRSLSICLEDLFFEIIDKLNVYEKLPLIGDVENSCVVLEYIYSLFSSMQQANMDIKTASNYFASIFENGISLKYKLSTTNSDSVHIMTIHKSKGLEFPYCFFPMLGSSFNKIEIKQSYGFSLKYGAYIPFSSEGNNDTIIKDLVALETNRCDISEKVRLLYVALTRAKEKFYLISNNKEYNPKQLTKEGFNSFNSMLSSLFFLNEYKYEIDLDTLGLTKDYKKIKYFNKLNGNEEITYDDLNFTSQEVEKKHISKELKELTVSNLNKTLELGLEFHEILEVLDFNNINLKQMNLSPFMQSTIEEILKNDVFKNIKSAKTYHEHEFYFEDYHGIIDLLCIYEDHIDIIDYKLSNVSSEEYIRQLSIYKEYVCSKSNLNVNCYLLSIMKKEVKKVL